MGLQEQNTREMGMSRFLSKREKQVLELIASGSSNKEISDALSISLSTVENHIHNLYAKLNLINRAQAVIYAFKMGIVKEHNTIEKQE